MFRGINADVIPAPLDYLYNLRIAKAPFRHNAAWAVLTAGFNAHFVAVDHFLFDSNTDASAQHQEAGANDNNTHCLPRNTLLTTPDMPTWLETCFLLRPCYNHGLSHNLAKADKHMISFPPILPSPVLRPAGWLVSICHSEFRHSAQVKVQPCHRIAILGHVCVLCASRSK